MDPTAPLTAPSVPPVTPLPATLPAAPAGPGVPAWAEGAILLGLFAWAVTAAAVAARFRLWELSRVVGPQRLAPSGSAGPLWGYGVAAFAVLLGGQIALGLALGGDPPTAPTTQPATAPVATDKARAAPEALPNPAGLIVASAAAAALALAFLVALDARHPARLLDALGLTPGRLPAGVGYAAVGGVVILPIVFAATIANALFRQWAGWDDAVSHPLLQALGERPNLAWLMVLAAGIIVPVFEELLFRGHLQTALAHAFASFGRRGDPIDADCPTDAPGDQSDTPMSPVPPTHPDFYAIPYADAALAGSPPTGPTGPTARWAAIVLTSVVFASIHPPFSIPIIFVFSICLGYLYERTGNLWSNIVVHGAFNTMQTVLFLVVTR